MLISSSSLFPVTRIYTDENGDSQFGIFHIEMKSDGTTCVCDSAMLRYSLLVQEFRFQRPSSVSQCSLNTVTAKKCPAMFVGGANPG